jgi:hypothetical protein
LIAASYSTIFGILHHVDHVVRGNQTGWPFIEEVKPFTFSLLFCALLLPGLYLTWRGRLSARYWLSTAVVGLAVVGWIHFVPTRFRRHRFGTSTGFTIAWTHPSGLTQG